MLKTRIITALVLLFALLGALFLLPQIGWLVVVSLVAAVAAWEWGGLARFAGLQRYAYSASMGLACLGAGALSGLAAELPESAALRAVLPLYVIALFFWIACVPLWLKHKWQLGNAPVAVVLGLVVILPPALVMAQLRQLTPWLLLVVMSLVWLADIAAYFAGRAFGRRKLAPNISPGKSWEGVIGAVIAVPVYGVLVVFGVFPHGLSASVIFGLVPALMVYTALSVEGDLFESLLKRQAGLKDSGSILPGHGGILDRIDSLTSTLPLAGLLSLLFFP